MIVLVSCFILSFENLDSGTTLGTVMAMISNTGLIIGPSIGFSDTLVGFSQFSYLYMSLLMLAGRLELFTIVLLFSPAFWRKNH
jgi:trk system potassium uptake protein TrkH